jgi:hypothetical protein
MLVKATGENTFLLLIDILGFSKYCNTQSPEEIYSLVDKFVNEAKIFEDRDLGYNILYFSDTILFYQKNNLPIDQAFNDIYSIASIIFTNLLSQEIAIRGAITYGTFITKMNQRNDINLFYGKAFIEAHEIQSAEKSLSISISKSALECLDKNHIDWLTSGKIIIPKEDRYLLNTFHHIRESICLPQSELIQDLDYCSEINAIKFIKRKTIEMNIPSDVLLKYQNTISFLLDVFSKEIFPEVNYILNSIE